MEKPEEEYLQICLLFFRRVAAEQQTDDLRSGSWTYAEWRFVPSPDFCVDTFWWFPWMRVPVFPARYSEASALLPVW